MNRFEFIQSSHRNGAFCRPLGFPNRELSATIPGQELSLRRLADVSAGIVPGPGHEFRGLALSPEQLSSLDVKPKTAVFNGVKVDDISIVEQRDRDMFDVQRELRRTKGNVKVELDKAQREYNKSKIND